MTEARLFLGRGHEIKTAERLISGIQDGRGSCLAIVGEPGIGKTRLLTEVRATAEARDVNVFTTACLPFTTPLPLDPITDLLRRMVADGFTDVAVPSRSESGSAVFGEAVDALAYAALSGGALMLLLDDLQWSDSMTLTLLQYCTVRFPDLPLGWVVAARPSNRLRAFWHHLDRSDTGERLELKGLARSEVAGLVRAVTGATRVSRSLVDAVHERTGGNPFLCEELLRSIPSHPPIPWDQQGAKAVGELVPPMITESVAVQMQELDPQGRELLWWSSVFPEPVDLRWLRAAAAIEDFGAQVETLIERGFLVPANGIGVRFRHVLVRDSVYTTIPLGDRAGRHSVAADVLEGGSLPQRGPQLVRAHRHEEAAALYEQLGHEALARGGAEDAIRLFDFAQTQALAAGAGAAQRSAIAGLVFALLQDGQHDEARLRAGELDRDLADSGTPSERLKFLARYATALFDHASDLEGALSVLEPSEAVAGESDEASVMESAIAHAYILDRAGRPAEARPFADRGLEIAIRRGDLTAEVRARNHLGLILGETQSAHAGIEVLEQSVRLAREADLLPEFAYGHLNLSYLWGVAGDEQKGAEIAIRGLEMGRLPPALEALLRGNAAIGLMYAGDLDGALANLLTARDIAARAGPQTENRIMVQLCFVHVMRGELEDVERILQEIDFVPDSWEYYRAMEPRGRMLEEGARLAEALECYLQGAAVEDHPGSLWCLWGVVRVASALGQKSVADDAVRGIENVGDRWSASTWIRPAARGYQSANDGRPDDGADLLDTAAASCAEAFEKVGLKLEAARLRGDRAGIVDAIDEYEAMGAVRAADRARATARSLGMRPGRRRQRVGVLTRREQEIALMVASGKTNSEIGSALFLSPRTIERHVGNLLTKLGYRSRTQLAAEVAAGRLPEGLRQSKQPAPLEGRGVSSAR